MHPTLLVADPRGTLSHSVASCFCHHDYRIETAVDGVECVTKLCSLAPDVLILQAGLLWGGVDGILAEIRVNQSIPYTLTVLVDGNYSHGREIELLTSPVVRWLRSPLRLPMLRSAIESAIVAARDMQSSSRAARSLAH